MNNLYKYMVGCARQVAALPFIMVLTGCGAEKPDAPDYSKIQEAIGEPGCNSVTPNYSAVAGGPGFYGTWSSSWHGTTCGGVVAHLTFLTPKQYTHVSAYDFATFPTNESDCVNSALWEQGMDSYCFAGNCVWVQDPNDDTHSNQTLWVGSWTGSSCEFVLYPGYHPLWDHSAGSSSQAARTVSAALRWNGSAWIPQQSWAGFYVY